MNNNFHRYFHTCNGYGHKANQCRSRSHTVNSIQKNVNCYKCKQSKHYANQCKNENMEKSTEKNVVKDSGSKRKEVLVWRKREVKNGSMPSVS